MNNSTNDNMDINIALLIDVDNIASKYTESILNELSKYGKVTIRRMYGDWSQTRLKAWLQCASQYSLTPIMQPNNTPGKNASDIGLIIDAMDILYSGHVEGFCIVSSDSDFTKLAARLREAGMYVVGMGEKKTPMPFIAACELFKYLEVLAPLPTATAPADNRTKTDKTDNGKDSMASLDELIEAIKVIVTESSDEDGWAFLGEVGKKLNKRYPDFDTRNYGYSKLTPLISSLKQFEIQSRKSSRPHITLKYIRNK